MKIDEFIEKNKALGIKKYFPGETCKIYLICTKAGKIIYIGRTENIDGRMNTHNKKEEFNGSIKYYFECPKDKCNDKEKELIQEIKPKFNICFGIKKIKSTIQNLILNVEKIKKELKRNGWTQQDFADKLDMSFQSIYWIFSHKSTRLSTINKMAKVLEVDAKDLLI